MAQRTARRRLLPWPTLVLVGAVIALGAGIAVAFAARDSGPGPARTVEAVCRVASLAAEGDPERARNAFIDEAHEPIHELAQAAAVAGDRAAAARLLEAKEVIEAADSRPTSDDADSLVAATVDAARVAGRSTTGCR